MVIFCHSGNRTRKNRLKNNSGDFYNNSVFYSCVTTAGLAEIFLS